MTAAREDEHANELITSLRSGLLRNLGSLCNMNLYDRAYSGTKLLIEDYISEVIRCLEYLDTRILSHYQGVVDHRASTFSTPQQKLDFFHDTRQSFGRSALVLHGGSLFGLCHLGVVKALYLHGLLPRIISGATVGALVGALVCSFSDDELLSVLDNATREIPATFSDKHSEIKFYSNFERVVRSAYPSEILIFEQYVRSKIGDLTFEEAYIKSDRALNITVTPSNDSVPKLLNYLTTPNVIIWSAVSASIGTGIIHHDVELLVKDHLGQIVPYTQEMLPHFVHCKYYKGSPVASPPTLYSSSLFNRNHTNINTKSKVVHFTVHEDYDDYDDDDEDNDIEDLDYNINKNKTSNNNNNDNNNNRNNNPLHGKQCLCYKPVRYRPSNLAIYSERDSPYTKIAELFNVNNFTVSLARPYLAPLLAGENNYRGYGGLRPRISRVFRLEIQHRLRQLAKFGFLPEIIQRVFVDEKIPQLGGLELTLVPELPSFIRDLGKAFDSQDMRAKVDYLVRVGERSVWPNLQIIWARCAIEFVLDDLYNMARKSPNKR